MGVIVFDSSESKVNAPAMTFCSFDFNLDLEKLLSDERFFLLKENFDCLVALMIRSFNELYSTFHLKRILVQSQ